MDISKKRKNKIFGSLAILFASILAFALIFSSVNFKASPFFGAKANSDYRLVLDSSNAISTQGDHVQKTLRGSNVTLTYTNVSSSSGKHTRINNGGTIVNKDLIHSIDTINAVYSGTGTLKARISYISSSWGEYFNVVSGNNIEVGSHPYYIEFKAESGYVDLTSATIEFTCQTNTDAEPQQSVGSYAITFNAAGSDSSSDISSSSSSIKEQVTSGDSYISSFSSGSKIYEGASGLKFGSSKAAGSLTINFSSSSVQNEITTVDISTAQYSTDSGKFRVYVNGSTSYTEITPSAGGSVSVNGTLTSLEIETTSKRAYLCGLDLNYNTTVDPDAPYNPDVYETGFTADDVNKNEYTTNSIFDNENALSAAKVMSDGTTRPLTSNEYTYQITNSSGNPVNSSEKFPEIGAYTLTVNYGNYIPVEITLNVGEYVWVTDVAASMTITTFNTATVLNEHLEGNLKATLEYSNGSSTSDIAYSEFANYGIALKLLNPKGITYDIENVLGTAGTWTLKVFSVEDENMYYNISITVNAIPVQTITLNETTALLTVEDTLQLEATVNPTNATNSVVNWASNNADVASVDENGLVTAIAVGSATITATAVDGSNTYGSCVITVNAKPTTTDYQIDATSSSQVSSSSTSSVIFTNSPVTVTIDKSSSSTNANNYVASGTTPHTRVYTSQRFTISAGGNSISQIVIHGTSDKGVSGFTSSTWTNASISYSGNEITLTPTDPESDVYCTISGTSSFSGVTVTVGGGQAATRVYPTSISLSGTNSFSIGGTSQLEVTYIPSDTNVKNVTFSSSNTSVATVSNTGLVTGVAQGSATITATAEAESGTVSATRSITVTPIAVTSVSVDTNSASVKVGKTVTLVATVNPANATNKNITWTSSDTSIATVSSSGVVTGVAAGSATITVKTADGNKTAQCVVTVTASGGEESFSITYTDLPTTYQTGSTIYTASSGIKFQAYNCANYSSKMQFKASSGYLQSTEDLELQSITINDRESNTLTVYGSNTAGSFSTVITGTNDVYDLTGYSYFKVARTASGAGYCSSITVLTGTPTPTDPTSIIMSSTSAEVGTGGTKQLSVSYVPSNANQNKQLTWTSSNTNVATVNSDGLVSVKSTATAGQTATITAKLTNIPTISATCTITVVEQQKDDHTVLIYICGADLESENSLATGDIQEMLKVSGQPDDVNIVIETGGASSWASTYGISSTKLERWHVENKSLVKDASLTYASMGLTSTLQSFLEYGLNNYPAERTGLVLWNHGGGMHGVCYDEKKSDDSLLDNEVKSAVSGALSNCGMSGQKLEWIGYDACLMAVQDIAEMNSSYFNYMIASEESEAGYGWDYDNWIDDLYAKKTTPVILKAICDSFISDNGGVNSSSGDQTLSYLDLSKAAAYKTAWENMAAQLQSKLTSSNKSTFNNAIINNVKHFADSDYDYFCLFDAKDFINKLASASAFSSFRIDSSYTTAVLNAHAQLVAYSTAQKGAGNAYGLCMYWCNNSTYSDMSVYTTSHTNFTTWRSINNTYGTHK